MPHPLLCTHLLGSWPRTARPAASCLRLEARDLQQGAMHTQGTQPQGGSLWEAREADTGPVVPA